MGLGRGWGHLSAQHYLVDEALPKGAVFVQDILHEVVEQTL